MPLIPLSRLAPRLRRSVEGLNLELEGVFVSETAKEQHKVSVCLHVLVFLTYNLSSKSSVTTVCF